MIYPPIQSLSSVFHLTSPPPFPRAAPRCFRPRLHRRPSRQRLTPKSHTHRVLYLNDAQVLGCYLLSGLTPRAVSSGQEMSCLGGSRQSPGLAVITVGTSGVVALVPGAAISSSSSSSSRDALSKLGVLPGGCEVRPFVGGAGSVMIVGASLNGG